MVQQKPQSGIKPAQICDAQSIAEIHVLSWWSAYKGLVPDEVLTNLCIYDRARRWRETLAEPNHGILKQVMNGHIIGFSHATRSKDEDASGDTADIHAIYLVPDYIGKGNGKELMQQTLVHLKDSGFLTATLWVMDTNRAAIEFYVSQGFVDDNITKPHRLRGGHLVTIKRFRIHL